MRTLPLVLLAALMVCAQSREEAEAKLRSRLSKAAPGSTFEIRVGESASGPMLVAAVGSGDDSQVFIERFDRLDSPGLKPGASLRIRPVFQQQERVLDFAIDGDRRVVLEPRRVVIGNMILPFTPAEPMPRDIRGRLLVRGDNIDVRLPGTSCNGTNAMVCRGDDSSWREGYVDVAWVARRNYLTSTAVPQKSFYTIASFAPGRSVVAPVEGGAKLREDVGSDIAAVRTECSTAAIVATSAGPNETLQAFEWTGGSLRPLTDPAPLPGPVVALWPSEQPSEVSLVVRNSMTGEYEASRVSLDCGR